MASSKMNVKVIAFEKIAYSYDYLKSLSPKNLNVLACEDSENTMMWDNIPEFEDYINGPLGRALLKENHVLFVDND